MTFGELEVRDKFRSDAVPGVRFRKAPNGMGECVEDPNKSQFFWDTAVVTPVAPEPVAEAEAGDDAKPKGRGRKTKGEKSDAGEAEAEAGDDNEPTEENTAPANDAKE